ncbi:DNA-directed RNA polymerase subunit beta' [bacterium (Candidatus Gribaldobacteria) CG10_big_fil_rev_8_21_14_0_10_37_46]|uniref:DNA-directed RNA polymerase subunit beta' n=1 Tax=bacterium (Candidatus Gribaldobacteria) CG10_big_fil_rev_8_21_14_0_10_37_46 TaxID=2014276 RepID=A0A2H0UXN2_9BACT|nr:MAG: DNA-directed RNA polymerase subunit beta' [bacterium (Candidatus Gribaldobacteria) CG10_big_fil_rev_8_21_14_0_10_37_46]
MQISNLESIRIKLASAEEILNWSHGEVTKPETINYRTQKPEKDGLFCERIFGPTKDYECYCGKYKGIRYKGVICDRCGVELTRSSVRRERMGHIKLASPCSHIWFLRGVPSRIGLVLDVPMQQLEKVIYFAAYIITEVNEELKKKILRGGIDEEYKTKSRDKSKKFDKAELKKARDEAREEVLGLKPLKVLSETAYWNLSLKYGEIFEAGTGAETLRKIFEKIDLKKTISQLKKQTEKTIASSKLKSLGRLRFFQWMEKAKIRPERMFLEVLPVLPPELRPMVQLDGGRYASSDLNDLYRRVINRNNRLKYLIEISAPEVIIRNEKRMLQEAVDALLDNGMRKGQTTTATTGGRRLLKSLADTLKGKQGRFRKNLLGKRVDYSGRSVIAVGPELKLSQCGLPKIMALELFRPFVIKKLLDKELAYNIRGASKLIEEGTDEVWESLEEIVKDKLVLLNRAPTLHRLGIQAFQPILIEGEAIKIHPLVCKAFNADFDGDQMAVHLPLSDEAQKEARNLMRSTKNLLKPSTGLPVVSPSQDIVLGCYFLTETKGGAQGEENRFSSSPFAGAREGEENRFSSSPFAGAREGEGKTFSGPEEVILAYELRKIDLQAKIRVLSSSLKKKIKGGPTGAPTEGGSGYPSKPLIETTAGRIIFNQALPEDYPYFNENIDFKILSRMTADIIEKYNEEEIEQTLDKIKELGLEYSTLSGISWGMDDLIVPKEKKELLEEAEIKVELIKKHYKKGLLSLEEKSAKVIETWQDMKEKLEKLVIKTLPKDGPVVSIVGSGARGSWGQSIQMAGMKGLVTNPAGRIIELPIKHSFKEGLDILEYFISTHGARKGAADTALRTSAGGYLTRCLIDVAHELIVSEEDCGDKNGVVLLRKDSEDIGQDFAFEIVGRIALENVKCQMTNDKFKKGKVIVKEGEIIDWEKAKAIDRSSIEEVRVRSPLTCKTLRGVCQKCYGWEMGRNELVRIGEAVGIIAAQSIGEPGTQLTLRTFHLGGVAGGGDITQGLPRVKEIFELREPKGEANMSEIAGLVEKIDLKERVITIVGQGEDQKKVVEYKIPLGRGLWVEKGERIEKGQQLCEGSLNLRKLLRAQGPEETQRYITREVKRIYTSEGVSIHGKHIEMITRQMFSRMKIKNGGDSNWLPGQIVTRAEFEEVKNELKNKKETLPKGSPIFLGITKVSLTSDSFLSAASFQETSRVLIRSCLEGKEDKLRGLKENVIIGKLIPAGTGFRES